MVVLSSVSEPETQPGSDRICLTHIPFCSAVGVPVLCIQRLPLDPDRINVSCRSVPSREIVRT